MSFPQHIAIIMDGNGRWAQRQGLSRSDGHRAGAENVRRIVTHCRTLGVRHLTLYTFSRENWNRPVAEVSTLFALLVEFLGQEVPRLVEQEIALRVLGDIEPLPLLSRTALNHALKRTAGGSKMTLNLALNYSARDEIVRAVRGLVRDGLPEDKIDAESLSERLYTAGQPDPDLVIRTSGEVRISNFLLFQCAYSEYYFTDVLWPDFDTEEREGALKVSATRGRRFGKTQGRMRDGG